MWAKCPSCSLDIQIPRAKPQDDPESQKARNRDFNQLREAIRNGLTDIDLMEFTLAYGTECEVCSVWDGIIFSLDGRDKRFPCFQDLVDAGCFHGYNDECVSTCSAVDELIDKDRIAQQASIPNVKWTDINQMKQYSERIT